MDNRILLRNAEEMQQAITTVADSIISEFGSSELADVVLLGLYKAGVPLARRLAEIIKQRTGIALQCGMLDISMYRDDFGQRSALPLIRETVIPFDVEDAKLILVDDVLSTGRTIRAALDAVTDYGRPDLIRLAVLIDRGGVEYPIRADYIGWQIKCGNDRKIVVEFSEEDGSDGVYEVPWQHRAE
ncbi:MAG: bifunctional pyr operon transcriptional regulator/uracil phosphoribosyltransferase PyrR [Lentisphaerae bacterium]|nr:bifunctional pyr operon transcriptional regulator/uracil phosphoribosyltransferase PyrR [Lentisphaerota bacterium]